MFPVGYELGRQLTVLRDGRAGAEPGDDVGRRGSSWVVCMRNGKRAQVRWSVSVRGRLQGVYD